MAIGRTRRTFSIFSPTMDTTNVVGQSAFGSSMGSAKQLVKLFDIGDADIQLAATIRPTTVANSRRPKSLLSHQGRLASAPLALSLGSVASVTERGPLRVPGMRTRATRSNDSRLPETKLRMLTRTRTANRIG